MSVKNSLPYGVKNILPNNVKKCLSFSELVPVKESKEILLDGKGEPDTGEMKHTGQSEQAVEEAASFDHYFDPDESLKFGLVDEVVDFGKFMEECL